MKNKHYGVLTVIYVLLFVNLFFVFREKDISNFFNNFEYFQDNDNKSGYIFFETTGFDKGKLIEKLNGLSNNENIAFLVSNNIRENDEVIIFNNYFLGNQDYLIKLLPRDTKINFTEFYNGKFISNKNEKSQKLITFYEVEYNIYPINKILEEEFAIYTVDFFYNKNNTDIKNKILNQLSNYDIKVDEFERNEYELNSGLVQNSMKIIVIMLVLSIVSSIFFISNNLKTIGVYKLYGVKKFDIWKKVYIKYILISLILSIFVPVFGFIFILKSILGRATSALLIIIIAGLVLSIVNLFVSVIIINLIKKIRLSEIIKGRNINNKLTKVSYILLILTGITIIPIINNNIYRLSEGIIFLHEKIFSIKDHNKYGVLDLDQYTDDRNLKELIISDLDNEKTLIKFEPTSVFSNDMNNKNRYLAFFINENYLKDQSFKLNNNPIEIDSIKDVIIFMDKKTFELENWRIEQFVFEDGKSAEIKLFDYVKFENYSEEMVKRYSNIKPIFIYDKNNINNINTSNLIVKISSIDKVRDILIKNGINEDIEFVEGKEIFNNLLMNAMKFFAIQIMTILPYVLTFFVVARTFSELIKITNKKKWIIQRIFGHSKLRIYLDIFIDYLIVSIAILLSKFIFSETNFYSMASLFIVLVIVYVMSIYSVRYIKYSKEVNH